MSRRYYFPRNKSQVFYVVLLAKCYKKNGTTFQVPHAHLDRNHQYRLQRVHRNPIEFASRMLECEQTLHDCSSLEDPPSPNNQRLHLFCYVIDYALAQLERTCNQPRAGIRKIMPYCNQNVAFYSIGSPPSLFFTFS
ncbi:hypothetical protein D3C85_980810 [compost metagenome]